MNDSVNLTNDYQTTDAVENQHLKQDREDVAPVVTFYSYKGGVGRSMALVNLAVLLSREYALDVVVVDWDLEAQGYTDFSICLIGIFRTV
jgi:Mrp family chromosome partitioning ATPase